MFFGSFFILIFLALTGKFTLVFSMSSDQYLWILLTSVFLLLYVFTYYNGLKTIKVSVAASILTLGAPITAALNFFVKGSAISLMQGVGMLLVVCGVIAIVMLSELTVPVRQHARY